MNRALFLDRDGVINEDYGYVHKIEDFHFRDGIFDVCRAAQKARFKIIIVTNQAGIGRGLYSQQDFEQVSNFMVKSLDLNGIQLTDLYHCPFHPECGLGKYRKNSFDRKPNPGMLVKACSKHNINPKLSIMIGDSKSDELAALNIGISCFVNSTLHNWVDLAICALKR